jgi:PAS domain-containing protein
VTVDLAGRVTYCNRAAERIAQVGETVVGRAFSEIFRLPEG